MSKVSAVFDISAWAVKLMIGTVINGEPVVIYRRCVPCHCVRQDGTIENHEELKRVLLTLKTVNDNDLKVHASISAASLILPSNALKFFPREHSTLVISQNNIVSRIDARNILYSVRKEVPVENYEIADIVPETYKTDDGKLYDEIPIGAHSRSLTIKMRIYALPTGIAQDYIKTFEAAGIRITHRTVSSHAYSCLFKQYSNLPASYLLVDMGAEQTSVSLIGKGAAYSCHYAFLGGYSLSRNISDHFAIPFEDAEYLKIKYGYDNNLISYKPKLKSFAHQKEDVLNITQDELNETILTDLNNFIKYLDSAFNEVLSKNFKGNFASLPILFTGGASQLNGLESILKTKYAENKIYFAGGKVIGARDASYACCLGDLLALEAAKCTDDDGEESISTLSREGKSSNAKKDNRKPKKIGKVIQNNSKKTSNDEDVI